VTGSGTELSAVERRLLERTWRRIALRTALAFALAVFALEALAIGVVLYTGHADERRLLGQATADRDALTSPPPGIWIHELVGGTLRASPDAPDEPLDPAGLAQVAAGGPTRDTDVVRGGREFLVRTERRGDTVVQAALDETGRDRERHRLYLGLAGAGAAGLLVSAAVGTVVARRAVVPLGQAIARQQRFIADASHELRTPLAQLHLRAQLLRRELSAAADPDRLAADADQLVRGTRHMSELVQELLLAAQLRREPARFGPVDLHAIADEAVAAELPRARATGVTLAVRVQPQTAYLVRGTATTLRRVLASLLDNALGHTAAGGRITVVLHADPDAATVTCAVQDDGVGLAPGDASRLFERFARGRHGEGRRYGLGLALVQEAVDAHGGTVTAHGSPGQGATFTIALPAYPNGDDGTGNGDTDTSDGTPAG